MRHTKRIIKHSIQFNIMRVLLVLQISGLVKEGAAILCGNAKHPACTETPGRRSCRLQEVNSDEAGF